MNGKRYILGQLNWLKKSLNYLSLNSRNKLLFIIISILVSFLGGYLIYRATQWGPWAFSDSAAYLSAARNIQAGKGAIILNSNGSVTPVTEFPPLFPYILSLLTPTEGDFILTARWLDIILFSISIFTVGILSFSAFNNPITSLFSSIILAVSPLMVDTFSGFMSEPLFIALLLILVFLLFEFIKFQKSAILIPVFIISSLLPLIRYAGILFVICVSSFLVLFRKNFSQKLCKLIPLYILVCLTPIGVWFLNQFNNLNKIGGKRFSLNITLVKSVFQSILQEFKVIGGWFPYAGVYSSEIKNQLFIISFSFLFIFAITIGLMVNFKNKVEKNSKSLYLFQISLMLLIAYILFIGFTHSVTIPKIDIIDRMMAPIYPFMVLIFFSSFELLSEGKWLKFIKGGLLIIVLLTIRFFWISTFKAVEMLHADGNGFTSRQYQQSEFLSKLDSLPADQPMISNSAAFVLFYTNRFPLQVDQFHNRLYGSGNAYGEKSFREKNAALIILYPEFRNYYGEKSDQLLQSLTAGLQVNFRDEIGGVYYYHE